MRENAYQNQLIRKLEELFPECIVLKNDSGYLQGVPDLTIFWGPNWAFLEVKADESSPEEPNQRYYVEEAQRMSFGAFIYPQNEEEVLNALQQSFRVRR